MPSFERANDLGVNHLSCFHIVIPGFLKLIGRKVAVHLQEDEFSGVRQNSHWKVCLTVIVLFLVQIADPNIVNLAAGNRDDHVAHWDASMGESDGCRCDSCAASTSLSTDNLDLDANLAARIEFSQYYALERLSSNLGDFSAAAVESWTNPVCRREWRHIVAHIEHSTVLTLNLTRVSLHRPVNSCDDIV